MFANISPEWAAAFICALVVALGNKIWNIRREDDQEKIAAAMREAQAIVGQIAMTVPADTTAANLILLCKAAVAFQLGKVALDPNDARIAPKLQATIAESVERWIRAHPDQAAITPPVVEKLDDKAALQGQQRQLEPKEKV